MIRDDQPRDPLAEALARRVGIHVDDSDAQEPKVDPAPDIGAGRRGRAWGRGPDPLVDLLCEKLGINRR